MANHLVDQLLAAGQMAAYSTFTGKYFVLTGKVVQGEQKSRLINFPSFNLIHSASGFSLKLGCYHTLTKFREKYYYGLTTLLVKKWAPDSIFSYTYLENFTGDLYHHSLSVYFLKFYRSNVPFPGWKAMKKLLTIDCQQFNQKVKINKTKL